MQEIRWEFYPLVAQSERAHAWLEMQHNLQLAPTAIDAYGRSLNDYLTFCATCHTAPELITREQIALYVRDLASRPNPKGAHILILDSGCGLSKSTMRLRITVARLFQDYLVFHQIRPDNPISRGHYVPGKAFGGYRERALIPTYHKLPWLPSDEEWLTVIEVLKEECLRNQVMFLLAYDGALRREELVTLEIEDFDFAYRQIRVQAEHAKNGAERFVGSRVLMSGVRSKRCRQARPLTWWVDSKRESTGEGGTLVDAGPRCFRRGKRPTRSRAASPARLAH